LTAFYLVAEALKTSDWCETEDLGAIYYRFCGPIKQAWPTSMAATTPVYAGAPIGGCVGGKW
jgi:hypothetical protein